MRRLADLILLLLTAPAVMASQTIYKCTEAGGTIVYSQSPCSTDAARVETIETAGAESAGTRDALAEQSEFVRMNDVRRLCDEHLESVRNNYAAQYRRIGNEIARLEVEIKSVDYRIRGSTYDTDLRRQIPALQKQRAELEENEASEQATVRDGCQANIEAEKKRQAKAAAARAKARRVAEEAAAAKAAEEKAAAELAAKEKAEQELKLLNDGK